MKTNRKTSKESKMTVTTPKLIRLAGLSAMVAGIIFAAIAPVSLPVNSSLFIIITSFKTSISIFGLLGMTGLYARQVEETGWLGLVGFFLFTGWMTMVCGFSFVEAFILPKLATESPAFVAGWMGMFSGSPSAVDLGILPTLWNISGPMYIFGPLLFGIATFRARVLPRWAGLLLALNIVWVPLGAIVPAEYQPKIMISVGLAVAWLGYALFAERHEKASELAPAYSAKAGASKAA